MRVVGSLLLIAACFVACTHSYPGAHKDDSDEKNVDTLLVLPSDMKDRFVRPAVPFDFPDVSFGDSIEDSSSSWGWPNPFYRWYSGFDPIMKRIKDISKKVSDILSRNPEQGLLGAAELPEGANTTSTTKIINGHVVTINETTYMNGDDEYGTLFRVRIIDVKPQNETTVSTESKADAEPTTLPVVTTTAATETSRTAAFSEEEKTTTARNVELVEDYNDIPNNQVENIV